MPTPQLDKLARLLVRYSTAVKPGNVVSLVSSPVAEPLVVALYREVLRAGGHPLVRMTPEACREVLQQHGTEDQLRFVSPLEVCEVESVDVAIHIHATEHRSGLSDGAPARQRLHGQARRPLVSRFLQRATEQSLRWVGVQYPYTKATGNADLSPAAYQQLVFAAGMLDRDDPAAAWGVQSERQQRLVDYLHGVQELHLATPSGTRLRLGVAGRTWINCDGHKNFPDGEVFTAPLEEVTEGTVYFDLPAVHGQRKIQGVRLTFRAGRLVDASASRGEDYLFDRLDQDGGARILGEVALGCNFALTRPTGHVLLDEKMGGTFHLALGAAYPESGGRNASTLHWDLVGDLRPGGWVRADGQVISAAGRFTRADWPGAKPA